ncbi:4'-phosphopantetheinyl transferase family protein [Pedobacter gandavensis]|uniref:4'-phosphopantetheinyl transferase superfamily protein n=1 Tax=Pedobacter gandavensis TaxID=2679963 RepID=A0ABR6ETL3_9SPHI|nr:4'-phosphopantetheinyl transferase superfamily protein [Pedobacter gandavensis]MBB2148392.1 4'-phosphopantetheinyl transferase superfamily protein [Pedobacter gandavensis]
MEPTADNLMIGQINWLLYDGQDLSIKDFVHVFKIKASDYFKKINPNGILSAEELAKASRFLHQQSRENYTVRKYFLRKLLAHFLGSPAEGLVFQLKDNKKPAIDGLSFNVSHSKDLITIAISESPIGVDIEYVDPYFQYQEVVDLCFSTEEKAMLGNSALPILTFYLLWTRKEAIVKSTGEGIVEQLQEVPCKDIRVFRNGLDYDIASFFATETHLLSTATPTDSKPVKFWELSNGLNFF